MNVESALTNVLYIVPPTYGTTISAFILNVHSSSSLVVELKVIALIKEGCVDSEASMDMFCSNRNLNAWPVACCKLYTVTALLTEKLGLLWSKAPSTYCSI